VQFYTWAEFPHSLTGTTATHQLASPICIFKTATNKHNRQTKQKCLILHKVKRFAITIIFARVQAYSTYYNKLFCPKQIQLSRDEAHKQRKQ
jgi:hypothetical protein